MKLSHILEDTNFYKINIQGLSKNNMIMSVVDHRKGKRQESHGSVHFRRDIFHSLLLGCMIP